MLRVYIKIYVTHNHPKIYKLILSGILLYIHFKRSQEEFLARSRGKYPEHCILQIGGILLFINIGLKSTD